MITVEKIFTSITPEIKKSFRKKQNEAIRLHQKYLDEYELKIGLFFSEYGKQNAETKTRRYLWESANKFTLELIEWIKSVTYSTDNFIPSKYWADWNNSFYATIKNFPEVVQLEINDEIWKTKFKRNLARSLFFLQKHVGKFTGTKTDFILNSRKLHLKNLLVAEIEIPVAFLILTENQRFFQLITRHLLKFNEISELIKEKIVELNPPEDPSGDIDSQGQLEEISGDQFLQEISKLRKEISTFKKDSETRLKAEIEKIKRQFQRIWDIAGTFLYPSYKFSKKAIEHRKIKSEKYLLQNKEAWQNQLFGCLEEWTKDLEIESFQLETQMDCFDTQQRLLSKLNIKILTAFQDAENILEISSEKIEKVEVEESSDLKRVIFTENRTLLKDLRQEKLPQILDAISHTNIENEYEHFVEKIKQNAELFPEEHVAFKNIDTINLLPESRLNELPLKALIQNEILVDVLKQQQNFSEKIKADQEDALRRISEIDQIVEFNLEAALSLIRQEEGKEEDLLFEKAKQIVTEGLNRTTNQLLELKEFLRGLLNETIKVVSQTSFKINSEIQVLADSEKIFELKLRSAKAQSRQKLIYHRNQILTHIKTFFPTLFKSVRNRYLQLLSLYFRVRKMTGLIQTQVKVDEKLSSYLNEVNQKRSQLPYVYQRLFRLEPLEDERFFSGRKSEMEKIESLFRFWKEGASFTLSIVGERGSGKTTLINFAEMAYLKGYRLLKVDLDKTIRENELIGILIKSFKAENINTFEELQSYIDNLNSRTIFIFENIQNLFIRTIDGFDSLERFLLFISKTQPKVFWIISCSLYAWDYLDKVLKISKFFTKVIFLEALTKEDMENIILKRHRVSGYNYTIEMSEEIKKIKKFKKLKSSEEKHKFLADRFFQQLAELSAGNVRVAILFWLSAINKIEKDKLILSSNIEFDHTFLYNLPSEELFTLAAIIQHENILLEDHSKVFKQSLQKSELLLNRLGNVGLLQKNERGYFIHPFLYRPVVKALKSKNILH